MHFKKQNDEVNKIDGKTGRWTAVATDEKTCVAPARRR
jgi:hypothetical protein